MTVTTYDPNQQPLVSVTPTAAKYFTSRIQKEDGTAIRLSVAKSGCSGLKYVLDVVSEPQADDETLKINDTLTLYVEKNREAIVAGTELDYIQEGINWVVKYKNPNETSSCGCGESFTIDESKGTA
ncbi:MAG: heme biosynthesis protein HemY [marine bacterium B5-7]|nr:MAG: heme biosynthesis protein HemY [marine bacterium B5-7]